MARKCPAETVLSLREYDEVKAVAGGGHQPRRGPWYCAYPAATIHFQHTVVLQQTMPAAPDGVDDVGKEPDPLWLVWSDDGRRGLRWRAGCRTYVRTDVDENGLLCVLPAGHGGDCDAEQNNEYQFSAEMQQTINDAYRRLQTIVTARTMGCPNVPIRDGEHAEADYARWAEFDHATHCPPQATCHQAATLSTVGNDVSFRQLINRYCPSARP